MRSSVQLGFVVAWCSAVALAQQSSPPLTQEPPLVLRTSGQPDRRLQVLKRSASSTGEVVVDVLDVDSRQRFTIPEKLLLALRPASTAAPVSTPRLAEAPPPPVEVRRPVPPPALLPPVIRELPAAPAPTPVAVVPTAPNDRWRPISTLDDPLTPKLPIPESAPPSSPSIIESYFTPVWREGPSCYCRHSTLIGR
jgi:hypothetical protein